jgi:hypothetical protein
VLNLVVASGYLSSLMGNPRVSRYLDRRHPEILTEFKVIVAATSWPANSPWVAGLEGHSLSRLAHPARLNKKIGASHFLLDFTASASIAVLVDGLLQCRCSAWP